MRIILAVLSILMTTSFIGMADGGKRKDRPSTRSGFAKVDADAVQIVRDAWGVPHIFAKHDHEVAYGLAWANAEDDFATMQELLIAGQGMAGRHTGKDGAKRDYMAHLFDVRGQVDAQFDTVFSEDFKRYIDGYAQGLNAFAHANPDEVLVHGLFPIEGKDLVYSNVFAACIVSGAHNDVAAILKGQHDRSGTWMGSNAMAANAGLTEDGSTILMINPHQPMEGPFSWYEAHLCSEDGLNILGGLFPGGPAIFLGTNENLGWAHTVNKLDLVDVYRLETHHRRKRLYKLDGEWHRMKIRPVLLKVKLSELLTVPVPKITYWTEHGAALRSKDGEFFAIRMGANQRVNTIEQMYRMNKASNFDEFYSALSMDTYPRYNVIYADKEGNIMYLNNGLIPVRDDVHDWSGVLPGNTSATIWNSFHTIQERPQLINPTCGYVFNTNNTPFNATCKAENLRATDFPAYYGFDTGDNNRSSRMMELLEEYDRLTLEDVKRIKFDCQYPDSSAFMASMDNFMKLDPDRFPDLAESIVKMQNWDRRATCDSEGAGMFILTYKYLFDKLEMGVHSFMDGMDVPEESYIEAIGYARGHLMEYFHTLDVTLGELQLHVRGDKEYGVNGFPDALAANYSMPYTNGRFKSFVADSYVQFAQWKDGKLTLESLHPYGSSNREGSPHFSDQMELYVEQRTKPMTLNREEIFRDAERIYHPRQKQ
ncbi:MAG: penicillin acylase family protein [Flavobacteriales bacterium]|nr:penicillin acylase family protein [Flavobacteriales bacterium]